MSSAAFIALVSAAIIGLLLWRALVVIARERNDDPRGSEPGDGYHTINAEYSSGLSGHSTSYKVPRDPQEYARRFVPKQPKD